MSYAPTDYSLYVQAITDRDAQLAEKHAQWQTAIVENDGCRKTLAESQRIIEQQRAVIESLSAERDEARAELSRLTTLRPIANLADRPDEQQVLFFYRSAPDREPYASMVYDREAIGWTPIPTPKEPTP